MVFVPFSLLLSCFCFIFCLFARVFVPLVAPVLGLVSESYASFRKAHREFFSSFLKKLSRYNQKEDTFPLNRATGTLEWACTPELCQVGSTP